MQKSDTQSSRRFIYGSNVLVAAGAAVLLVGVLNIIGYNRLVNIRFDLTSTRRWSLSDQTQHVVDNLKDDYRMVVLISKAREDHVQASDLIAEYGYLSSKLKIEEINPYDDASMIKFKKELVKAYDSEVTPMRQAVDRSAATLKTVRSEVKDHLTQVRQVLDDPQLTDENIKSFIQNVASAFGQIETQAKDLDEELAQTLEAALPDYAGAIRRMLAILSNYDEAIFAVVIERFNIAAEQASAPDAIKEKLLAIVESVRATRKALSPAIEQLKAVKTDTEYSKLTTQIVPETVILIGSNDKPPSVIHLGEMFKEPSPQELKALKPGERPERRFLGEEKITGALVAMELDTTPMVVFISSGQRPALGRGGEYMQVAARLQALNFDVRQWSTSGQPNPMTGQPMPPGPPPQPEEGQKVVWIALPVPPPDPRRPPPGGGDSQKIVDHLKQRMAKGDAVMVMLTISPMAAFGVTDPIADLVNTWGVTAQTDRLVMREVIGRGGKATFATQHPIDQWPSDSPITQAIAGMSGMFVSACPLQIDKDTPDGTEITALVVIEDKGLWAEANLQKLQSGDLQRDETTAADRFTVAAAIQQADHRMIVVTDPMWASDQITTYGQLGPGTAQLFGAAFPANAELFTNSTFWLLDLDELIAAGARSQDIRRIESIKPEKLRLLRWVLLLGLPIMAIASGMGVWFVRRRV